MVMQVGMMALGLLAIRYVAGSWLWSGLVFWYPGSIMVLLAGNIEFLIAAAIVLTARGHAGPLAFTALAKIAPILAVPRSGWREAALVLGIALLVTLPWLHLWPEWVEYLLRQPTTIATTSDRPGTCGCPSPWRCCQCGGLGPLHWRSWSPCPRCGWARWSSSSRSRASGSMGDPGQGSARRPARPTLGPGRPASRAAPAQGRVEIRRSNNPR